MLAVGRSLHLAVVVVGADGRHEENAQTCLGKLGARGSTRPGRKFRHATRAVQSPLGLAWRAKLRSSTEPPCIAFHSHFSQQQQHAICWVTSHTNALREGADPGRGGGAGLGASEGRALVQELGRVAPASQNMGFFLVSKTIIVSCQKIACMESVPKQPRALLAIGRARPSTKKIPVAPRKQKRKTKEKK